MENLDRHNKANIGTDSTTIMSTLTAAQFDSGLVFIRGHVGDLTRYLNDLDDARSRLGTIMRSTNPGSDTYRRAHQCAIICIVTACRANGTYRRLASDLDGLGNPTAGQAQAWKQTTAAELANINVYLQTAIGELVEALNLIAAELPDLPTGAGT